MSARAQSKTTRNHAIERPKLNSAIKILLSAFCLTMFLAVPAQAAQSITELSGELSHANGETTTQAASHPDTFVTTVRFGVDGTGLVREDPRFVIADLPPGLVGNPRPFGTCTEEQLAQQPPTCPLSSQVGSIEVELNGGSYGELPGVYNMVAPADRAAQFGFQVAGVLIHIDAIVSAEGDDGYHVRATFPEISEGLPVSGSILELWGVPADPSHDLRRGACTIPREEERCSATKVGLERVPFLTLPSHCSAGVQSFDLRADSWQTPGVFDFASFSSYANGDPMAFYGCDKVPFDASLSAKPETVQADSPTGLDVNLTMPQPLNPDGLSTAYLKKAEVTFPQGMTVNPATANGQSGCAPNQVRLGTDDPIGCPDSSKIGTVEIETPVLAKPLSGSVYLAKQNDNPFNSLLALYIVAEGPGVLVKLPGKVSPDPKTGQLVASFDDNPQLPFSSLKMRLKGGNRAPLVTPTQCGTYSTVAKMSSWSASNPDAPMPSETITSTSSFQITSGPNGSPCPPADSFGPEFTGGTVTPIAGAFSPLVIKASKPDGSAPFTGLQVKLPQGLLGKLAGIPYCSDSALAAASGKSGKAELASASCPAASKVGIVNVGSGAGGSPLNVSGSAYLAGPYKGAPLSLAVITPATAGPFDLGTVVIRNALQVNPVTAEITAVSDPIPTILQGIPLKIRSIYVEANRDQFTLNPTSCERMSFAGTLFSSSASKGVSNPFQVGACNALEFKPKLAIKLSGKTNRSSHPKLRATLTMPNGGANIARAAVTLPKTEFLAQDHIRTICTRVQYAADNCPKASVYGYAKAWSPLLDKPLEGPVYLRSSSNPLPDLVASLDGQIEIDLAGRIDTKDARIRNTFDLVPDAPVSKFVLTMQGGKKGLLVNNTELCKAKPRADVRFDGQNGKTADSQPLVKVDCGGKKRKGRKR